MMDRGAARQHAFRRIQDAKADSLTGGPRRAGHSTIPAVPRDRPAEDRRSIPGMDATNGATGGHRRMRLAKVTLAGFKSFADPTEFRFDEPGLRENSAQETSETVGNLDTPGQ